jgi:putative hydrolase of the HAD superfamily
VSELSLDPAGTWMVGNSPRSDINPAIEAGLGAIFVPHDHTWGAEKEELSSPELVITLQTFGDLVHYFGVEPSL